MKKYVFLLGILFLPSTVFARELKVENKKYEVLNYEETLKDAKIEKAFDQLNYLMEFLI